jgi:hypothetical protein
MAMLTSTHFHEVSAHHEASEAPRRAARGR